MDNNNMLNIITCPITMEIMREPVIGDDGQTYEKSAIITALKDNSKSPMTGEFMDINSLQINYGIKGMIEEYHRNPHMFDRTNRVNDINSVNNVNKFDFECNILDNKLYSNNQTKLLVNILQKEICNSHEPVDIVLVIDKSGSMGISATTTSEDMGYSVLDIVKHAVSTIIKSLKERYRVAIITYNDKITLLSTFTRMTPVGQSTLLSKVKSIYADNRTNMYGALIKALEQIKERGDTTRNASIYLFTDGLSNVGVPAKGEVKGLTNYMNTNFKNSIRPTICTFGFGSNLTSDSLSKIADIGDGWYCYIPDATFVGTIFVNSIVNTSSINVTNVMLYLYVINHNSKKDKGKYPIGMIQHGQTRSIILDLKNYKFEDDAVLNFTLNYNKNGRRYSQKYSVSYQKMMDTRQIYNEYIELELTLARDLTILVINKSYNYMTCLDQ